MNNIVINYLDHVAIRSKDPEVSAAWYEKVLGLKKYQKPEWGPYPIFMLAGKTGVAIFPANPGSSVSDPFNRSVRIDHFAFNVDKQNFEMAKKRFADLGIEFHFQDHHYMFSIYISDPDGHTVELTTLIVDEKSFYRS